MKTKDEIEQLANDHWEGCDGCDANDKYFFIKGFGCAYRQLQEDMSDISKVTRVEVIDTNGRVYQKWNCNVELSYQDDGRTLKVFIKPLNKQD